MKKNLFLAAGLAVALFATSCDSNNAGNDTVAVVNETAAEAPVETVENPNVVATAGSEATPSENAAVMNFEQTEYDFGSIKPGRDSGAHI